jgi:hypothetical protein
MNDQSAGQSVEELLQAAVDRLRALVADAGSPTIVRIPMLRECS